ncbi:MAG: Abi-alpha family protein [Terriglobia bacterium]
MSDPGQELAIRAWAELLGPVRDILEKITGPCATEIGLTFGEAARAYPLKRALKLFEKVKRMAASAGVELRPVARRLLFPILESALIEDDEGLHNRWAALLTNASAATFENDVLPSFPDILRQLIPVDAQFLDKAYDETVEEGQGHKRPIGESTLSSATPVMIGNLERLGLLSRDMVDMGDFTSGMTHHTFSPANHLFVSPFGRAFIPACRAPQRR